MTRADRENTSPNARPGGDGGRPSKRASLPRPICFAHRGAAAELPENTLPSFERALELGADALEMDLHLTSDGVVVVAHDPDGQRMAGIGAEIRRTSLADLKRWDVGHGFLEGKERPFRDRGFVVPTFEEVLDAFPDTFLNVDAKQLDPPVVPLLLDLLERKRATERVNVASFHERALLDARRRGFPGTTAIGPVETVLCLGLPARAIRALRAISVVGDAAQIPLRSGPIVLAKKALIDKLHRAGMSVDFWTINEPHIAREVAALGADGIMTDDPRSIVPVVRRYRDERDSA